jgi:hypothetical protein
LYYRDPNSGVIMAVRFAGKADGTIDAGSPEIRYAGTRVNNNATTNPVRHQLSVHPDGRQFLLRVVTQAVTNQSTGERTAVPQILAFTRDSARGFFGRGRGGNRGALATGLTVVQRWTSGMGRGAE